MLEAARSLDVRTVEERHVVRKPVEILMDLVKRRMRQGLSKENELRAPHSGRPSEV